ncbi:hypothetical protein BKA65DRAFT_1154 [Rhexocercosporidium sp. MPI-PUGE-AT-0058]|nr:hypothetical protein BKA65DRAFT_1154 [Rhexocercosporidium sp. MPI-PUGE-AT-0058]
MSAELPSSNPFRRKTPSTLPSAMSERPSTNLHISSQYENIPPEAASMEQTAIPKKITKKVRVQSPPPPSPSTPSIPDSSSTVGEDSYAVHGRPPSPPTPQADDPFDSVTSDTSENEEISRPTRAPANPFSKTLETMEHPEREAPISNPTNTTNAGRASMDVEAFKRLLMTGNAGLSTTPVQQVAHSHVAHTLGDGGSSTDTSSISRQSIFEAVQEPLPESPRTSHEISEAEDDRRGLVTERSVAPRKKPPPPSSRHGKLIKVELRDEGTSNALQSPPTPGSITSQHYFSSSPRSQTDLNKPLPPAPTRASHDLERESVFDKESAGKTPEPPSPSSSIRKKNPPAPPLARRHSQKVAESKLTRSDSTRLSPKPEEELPRIGLQENRRPSTDSVRVPPPPPSRRPGTVRGSSHTPVTSPSPVSLPTPPPARGSSRSVSGGKPPSVFNLDLSSTNKRASVMAPPPPPPRHSRSSLDVQSPGNLQRSSGEYTRRSNESARRGSQYEEPSVAVETESKNDILADLSKLQREIDALRQSETGRIT